MNGATLDGKRGFSPSQKTPGAASWTGCLDDPAGVVGLVVIESLVGLSGGCI